jgi:Plastocyanin
MCPNMFYCIKIKAMKKIIGSKSRILSGIAILFAILSISNSCTKTMSDGSGSGVYEGPTGINVISVDHGGFNPAEITVAAGTTITWTNKGLDTQSVTSDDGLFNSIISTNGSYSYKFLDAGTYQYFSRINPGMIGKVVVN